MQLTIDNLKQVGAFTGAPVEKEIKWKVGKEEFSATVYVRPMSYRSATAELAATRNNQDFIAARIASCICDEHGNPVFTIGDITGESDPDRGPLIDSLTYALLGAIAEVAGAGKTKS